MSSPWAISVFTPDYSTEQAFRQEHFVFSSLVARGSNISAGETMGFPLGTRTVLTTMQVVFTLSKRRSERAEVYSSM